MAKTMDSITDNSSSKEGDLKKCSNYRTISLISHLSKVLLKIINNRLKAKAEGILAEEQAGLRSGWSTVGQMANVRILEEKFATTNWNYITTSLTLKKPLTEYGGKHYGQSWRSITSV